MMDKNQINQHISRQYNAELEEVRQKVLAMGGLVEEQITDALNALVQIDSSIADTVLELGKKVNRYEIRVDEECTRILAKRQPAASDLRLIIAVLKTITDLERIGDESEKIAKMAIHLANEVADTSSTKRHFHSVMHMGEHVRAMVHDSLDAFARMDVDAALQVAKREKQADEEYVGISRQLITYMMEDPRSISPSLDVMWSARALERIGDHARNICEYVIYLVQGQDVRHVSFDEMTHLAKDE